MAKKELPPLARRLKELRHTAGLTQQQLAGAAGLSMSAVLQMEQGAKCDPRLSTLAALAAALGVPLAELVAGSEQVAAPPPADAPAPPPSPRPRRRKTP